MDNADRRILNALQANGRLTNQELGESVGLSGSQCSRRRSALEATGIIQGYQARLAETKLGLDVTAFVDVTLARHSRSQTADFAALVESVPEVQEAYAMTGEADYVLKVIVPDLRGLSRVLNDVLLANDAIQTVKSAIVLNRLKAGNNLPLELMQQDKR